MGGASPPRKSPTPGQSKWKASLSDATVCGTSLGEAGRGGDGLNPRTGTRHLSRVIHALRPSGRGASFFSRAGRLIIIHLNIGLGVYSLFVTIVMETASPHVPLPPVRSHEPPSNLRGGSTI